MNSEDKTALLDALRALLDQHPAAECIHTLTVNEDGSIDVVWLA